MKISTIVFCYIWINTITVNKIFGFIIPDEKKCRYMRVEKMLKARCHDMNLREVPQYLSSGVEVLDLSYNRIKKLRKTAFQRYKSVRYLLLYDNMIQSVESGTFSNLDSLEEIDLSNNALRSIPIELFSLPSLRNLYMDSNDLINLHEDLNSLQRPIKAPLEYLNIADCGLSDIPYLGILPKLWHLNASSNPLDQITVKNFSPLCHLKSVDLDKTLMPYCSCQLIMMFLGMRKIKAHSNFCDTTRNIDEASCQDTSNITIFDEDFDTCTAVIITTETQIKWLVVALSIAGVFIIILGLTLCINKQIKNNRQTRKLTSVSEVVKEKKIDHKLLQNNS